MIKKRGKIGRQLIVLGSAGGSIVGYALGVTNVDPIELDLSFERFLNPERVSMPDIDIDIADDRLGVLVASNELEPSVRKALEELASRRHALGRQPPSSTS